MRSGGGRARRVGAGALPLARWSERSLKFSRIFTEKAQLVFTLKPVARKSTGSCSPGFVPPVLDFALPCGAIVTGGHLPTRVGPSIHCKLLGKQRSRN